MKYLVFAKTILFLLLLLVVFSSCDKSVLDAKDSLSAENHVNICVLGNSYSNDAFSYVPFILKEYGYTCKIEIYYRGSMSLHDLDSQWYDDSKYGIADLDGKDHIRLHFSIDTRTQTRWQIEPVMNAQTVVSSQKWDVISIQQGGSRARFKETYTPYLQNVIRRINAAHPKSYKLAWFMAYNPASDNANQESLDTQKQICDENPFDIVMPVAAAVFSCQAHETLSKIGGSKYKRMYASDNVHLQEGLPCYVAALTIAETIMQEHFGYGTVLGNKIRPTDEWINSINGITPNGNSVGVTEDNCELAQRAAINAHNNKFEITPLK